MNPVTIRTDSSQDGRGYLLPSVQRGCHPMEILNVGPQDMGGQAIFSHELFIRMATGAKVGCLQTKRGRPRIFDIVGSMAVRADGNVGIFLLQKGLTVNTLSVPLE